jgi:hypothetical protein
MGAKTEAYNENSDVLRGTLISWMDVKQAKMEANLKKRKTATKASQERMEALMNVGLETMETRLGKIGAN